MGITELPVVFRCDFRHGVRHLTFVGTLPVDSPPEKFQKNLESHSISYCSCGRSAWLCRWLKAVVWAQSDYRLIATVVNRYFGHEILDEIWYDYK